MAMIHIMNCREIAVLLDSDGARHQPWITRVQFRVHLLTCWHCRLLARQIRWIGKVAREAMGTIAEPGADFEERILRHLSPPSKQS